MNMSKSNINGKKMSQEDKTRILEMLNPNSNVVFVDFKRK